MESDSPIKAWVKRHSPLKSRNKPLPPRPVADTPSPSKARTPGVLISGNASPAKDSNNTTNKTAKRKLSSFLKHKSIDHVEDVCRLQRQMQPTPVPHNDRPTSSQSGKEPVEELSERVSTLEAQLRAARAELANASTTTASALRRATPWRPRPPNPRRANSFQSEIATDREVLERQQRVLQGGMFDGVVESLLAPDYKSASRTAAAYSTRGTRGSRRSVSGSGHEQAMADYRNLESAHMDDNQDDARRLARLRSELRAAEWMRVQEHMAKEQDQHTTGSKRSRSAVQQGPEERPARRQKQSDVEFREKALPTVPRNRRAVSECGSNSIRLRSGPDAVPIVKTSQPYHVQYVNSKPRTPEDSNKATPPSEGKKSAPAECEQDENVTVYAADEDDERDWPDPGRRHAASPSRLEAVNEEYEWDEDVF